MNKRRLGQRGEEIACRFLESRGISIIKKNYFTKYGEIDLIGIEKETILFIEVKLRNNNNFGHPIESIGSKKQRSLIRTAEYFLSVNDVSEKDIRFDIITIFFYNLSQNYKIEWFKNQIFEQ